MKAFGTGRISADALEALFDGAVRDTIRRFQETHSPVISDGEQRKPSFATYPIHGAANLAGGGVTIRFADGHERQLPVLTAGPFRFATYAASYLEKAQKYATVPMKEAVISASALSLLYPQSGIRDYSREEFLEDLVREAATDIRRCLAAGARVQIDFTEGRLAVKLDPSKGLLDSFVALNNRVLAQFTAARAARDRRPHLPRRRPGFDAQRRRRLCGALAGALPRSRSTTSTCSWRARKIGSGS